MNRVILLSLLPFLLFSFIGCGGVKTTYTQDIEITAYPDKEANQNLAKSLMWLNRQYLIDNIPALTKENIIGMKIGWFIRNSDGASFFRVVYDLSDEKIKNTLDELKKDFEAVIPRIAKENAISDIEMNRILGISDGWVKDCINKNYESAWEKSDPVKLGVDFAGFKKSIDNSISTWGKLNSSKVFYLQRYLNFSGYPEVFCILYESNFEKVPEAKIQTNLAFEASGNCKVIGFKFIDKN